MSTVPMVQRYMSPHMTAVWEALERPMFLKGLYKVCEDIPNESVRRILYTFRNEGLVKKEDMKWRRN